MHANGTCICLSHNCVDLSRGHNESIALLEIGAKYSREFRDTFKGTMLLSNVHGFLALRCHCHKFSPFLLLYYRLYTPQVTMEPCDCPGFTGQQPMPN